MPDFKSITEALIEDVNREESFIILTFEKITDLLFFTIKWGCIPFFILVLFSFFKIY